MTPEQIEEAHRILEGAAACVVCEGPHDRERHAPKLGDTCPNDCRDSLAHRCVVRDEHERPRKPDAQRVEANDWNRASGLCTCDGCGFDYADHDTVRGFRWLTRLCDGRLVKL